ncbi:MAG: hypothetical protein AAF799_22330 [Myxococcota bacterium]
MNYWKLGLIGLGVWLTACGDDGNAGDSTTSTTSAETTIAATPASTSSGATSTTGTTAPVDGSGTTTGSTGTTGDSNAVETWGDTDVESCSGFPESSCQTHPLCYPLRGRTIVETEEGACLGPEEYIDCWPNNIPCDTAITYVCDRIDTPVVQLPSACIPWEWMECKPPARDLEPCP